jgi:hypothetical protein
VTDLCLARWSLVELFYAVSIPEQLRSDAVAAVSPELLPPDSGLTCFFDAAPAPVGSGGEAPVGIHGADAPVLDDEPGDALS